MLSMAGPVRGDVEARQSPPREGAPVLWKQEGAVCFRAQEADWNLLLPGVMGEYEPKIEVQFPEVLPAAKGSTVRLECFALGK